MEFKNSIDDDMLQKIRERMVTADQVRDLPRFPVDDIKKGDRYAIPLPRWISGDCGEQMYDIQVATEDATVKKEGIVFGPSVPMVDSSIQGRTRSIKSKYRLLTTWQTEILEIMEENNVPDETIGKVLGLL